MKLTSKFQAGGSSAQAQFVQWLAAVTGAQSEEQLQQIVQQLGEEGMKQMQQLFQQGVPPEQVQQMLAQHRNGGVIRWYRNLMNI